MTYNLAGRLGLPKLYHYQSFNASYLREVIVDGVLYFSKPSDFNDPWDCKPWFDDDLNDPAVIEAHLEYYAYSTRQHRKDVTEDEIAKRVAAFRANPTVLAAKIREFSDGLAAAIDAQYRVYCVGPRPDCELMWAHYSAKHQGVCLEFSVRNDLFLFGASGPIFG